MAAPIVVVEAGTLGLPALASVGMAVITLLELMVSLRSGGGTGACASGPTNYEVIHEYGLKTLSLLAFIA